MSLSTWKEKYYPIPANKTEREEALDRSIGKWEGLTETALKKHGLEVIDGDLREIEDPAEIFDIDSDSCALCWHYYEEPDLPHCARCPLAFLRAGVRCDRSMDGEIRQSPFRVWGYISDPAPMRKLLKRAKERA